LFIESSSGEPKRTALGSYANQLALGCLKKSIPYEMDDRTMTEMSLDELSALHQSVLSILASRLETRKRELEDRLRQLAPNFPTDPLAVDIQRFCRSFAIRLSRTKHGPDAANDALGNGVARCRNKPAGFPNQRNEPTRS
jgi:hypothetical protein